MTDNPGYPDRTRDLLVELAASAAIATLAALAGAAADRRMPARARTWLANQLTPKAQ